MAHTENTTTETDPEPASPTNPDDPFAGTLMILVVDIDSDNVAEGFAEAIGESNTPALQAQVAQDIRDFTKDGRLAQAYIRMIEASGQATAEVAKNLDRQMIGEVLQAVPTLTGLASAELMFQPRVISSVLTVTDDRAEHAETIGAILSSDAELAS